MIQEKNILQTELQGRISDLDLLGKRIHRQTIWLDLHGCSASSYVQLVSSCEVE